MINLHVGSKKVSANVAGKFFLCRLKRYFIFYIYIVLAVRVPKCSLKDICASSAELLLCS